MSHPLVLALFSDPATAAAAGRELRGLGIPREMISIVASSHEEEGLLAKASGGSPGSEIEDSRPAGRLAELSAHLLAAIALVMPGIGPIVADGPLAALEQAGLDHETSEAWEAQIQNGAVLVGVHVDATGIGQAQEVLTRNGGTHMAVGTWAH
jgi:hypothetical protein